MRTAKVLFAPCIAVVAWSLVSCSSEPTVSDGGTETPKQVSALLVQAQQRKTLERIPGSVRSALEATIEAKINGRIQNIKVPEGQAVTEGQVLLEINAEEMQARLEQALASQKQALADLERFKRLRPTGAVTQQEFDAVETKAKVAAATVSEASTMAAYRSIRAPFTGIVSRKLVEEGDQALPGKALLVVERDDLFRFESDIPDSVAANVGLGDAFQVQIADGSVELVGHVSEISPTTDPATRTRRVKLDLQADTSIRSGQYGYVLMPMQERTSIRIPASAVLERGQLEIAFVLQDGAARMRLVRTGRRTGAEVEIAAGLNDGELIATSELESLHDGDRVEIRS